jgi:acetoin utilization deacetylase AcuC-like enzyme
VATPRKRMKREEPSHSAADNHGIYGQWSLAHGAADGDAIVAGEAGVRVHYHDEYMVDLPQGHAFPMRKYVELREILLRESLVPRDSIVTPDEAPWDWISLVHTRDYCDRLAAGTLSRDEVRRIGLPWSTGLVVRSRRAVMGTVLAARDAVETGISGNLAGGTHHACSDHGEGYCVLNDVAIAIRRLRQEGRIVRALVVDLDVHHGNGTAEILAGDTDSFTLSVHGERNYPARKPPSTLDVALPDGTGDDAYMRAMVPALDDAIRRCRPDIAFYLAGVDVLAGDRFGRLALTRDGLAARDRHVLSTLRSARIPIALVLSGGYASTPALTADLHAEVYRQARALGLP